jgi:hypothetical protein
MRKPTRACGESNDANLVCDLTGPSTQTLQSLNAANVPRLRVPSNMACTKDSEVGHEAGKQLFVWVEVKFIYYFMNIAFHLICVYLNY